MAQIMGGGVRCTMKVMWRRVDHASLMSLNYLANMLFLVVLFCYGPNCGRIFSQILAVEILGF